MEPLGPLMQYSLRIVPPEVDDLQCEVDMLSML